MMRRLTRGGLVSCLLIIALLFASGQAGSPPGKLAIFTCLCAALLFAIGQIPAFSRLSLHEEGISIRSPFWRQELRWESLRRFMLVDFDHTGLGLTPDWARYSVGFVVGEEQLATIPRPLLKFHQWYGCHGTIPPVDGMHPYELFELLKHALAEARRSGTEA